MAVLMTDEGEVEMTEAKAHDLMFGRPGDMLTIGGVYRNMPNPAWRWWTFWRPRMVPSSTLQTFRVVGASCSEISVDQGADA